MWHTDVAASVDRAASAAPAEKLTTAIAGMIQNITVSIPCSGAELLTLASIMCERTIPRHRPPSVKSARHGIKRKAGDRQRDTALSGQISWNA
jgi:hypothetical protein